MDLPFAYSMFTCSPLSATPPLNRKVGQNISFNNEFTNSMYYIITAYIYRILSYGVYVIDTSLSDLVNYSPPAVFYLFIISVNRPSH
jgi:hypothetical protein